MPNVLVTMRFNEVQLNRIRAVSPDLRVTCEDAEQADYSTTDILYAGMPPRDLARAPRLKWVQLHMAGVNALYDHPVYKDSSIVLTTTSGVHGPTIAEYAITMLLALAHRVPRMVEWKARGAWPPDEQRWPLFVPTEVRGAVLGIIGYGSIGRELARIAKSAFGMTVFAQEPPPAGHPLYALDNVIVSPHVSGFLPSYDDNCADLFAENLRRYLAGQPLLNLVDRARGY